VLLLGIARGRPPGDERSGSVARDHLDRLTSQADGAHAQAGLPRKRARRLHRPSRRRDGSARSRHRRLHGHRPVSLGSAHRAWPRGDDTPDSVDRRASALVICLRATAYARSDEGEAPVTSGRGGRLASAHATATASRIHHRRRRSMAKATWASDDRGRVGAGHSAVPGTGLATSGAPRPSTDRRSAYFTRVRVPSARTTAPLSRRTT